MKRTIFAILAVVSLASPALADFPVTQFASADDGGVAILVKYYPGVSSNTSATVAVVQGTSLTFQVAAAAYTGFECPVAGALGGIIDETNAACNTIDEIVDVINGTSESFASGFFRAVIVDALGTDSADDLLADAGTQVTRADGLPIYSDTSANFAVGETRALVPSNCRTNIGCWVTPQGKILQNPFAGTRTEVRWVEGYSTYGAGTSILNIYSVLPSNKTNTQETVTTLWSETMGATTANKQFTQFQYVPLLGKPHEKVVVRITNSAAQATIRLLVDGVQKPAR